MICVQRLLKFHDCCRLFPLLIDFSADQRFCALIEASVRVETEDCLETGIFSLTAPLIEAGPRSLY